MFCDFQDHKWPDSFHLQSAGAELLEQRKDEKHMQGGPAEGAPSSDLPAACSHPGSPSPTACGAEQLPSWAQLTQTLVEKSNCNVME